MNILPIIFDNIIFSLQKNGGISVVWYELLTRCLKEYSECVRFIDYFALDNIFRKQLTLSEDKIIFSNTLGIKLKRYLPVHIKSESFEPFIFHSSYYRICQNKSAINITTVHDFTYEYFISGLKRKVHCWQKYRAIRNSDYIICISENTKRDLLKFLPDIDEKRVRVIYNGVSDDYYPIKKKSDIRLPFPLYSYVIFVGARGGYKNFELAVDAVAASDYKLLIVGGELSQEEVRLLNLKLPGRYKEVGRINNADLNVLYNGALALIYPSRYEGFGIPVLEAQKAGCPVIACNISSIPEIIGQTPLLLDELSVEAVVESLNLLSNGDIRQEVINKGLENAGRFTWDKMYEQVLSLYNEAWEAKVNLKSKD